MNVNFGALLVVGLLACTAIGFTGMLLRSPLGQALARRIGGRESDTDQQLLAEVDALRAELDQVHAELSEVHERLDFSERLLAARDAAASQPEVR